MILNQNNSMKFHIISIMVGLMLVVLGSIGFSFLYKNNIADLSFDTITYMVICIEIILFGIVLCLINFEDGLVRIILCIMAGLLIVGSIFNDELRFGMILLAGAMLVFIITIRFKNIFSTVVTMSVCATLFLVFSSIALKVVDEINGMLVLYVMFSLFIVVYRRFGKTINRWFISKALGFEKESKSYDDEQLKNQILLIYMMIFVLLNMWLYQEKIDGETWNLINNSFLTGLGIIQIDWNKIVFYFRKDSNNENSM